MKDRNLTSATPIDQELTNALAECLTRLEKEAVSIDACLEPHQNRVDAPRPLLTLAEKMIQLPRPVQRRAARQAGKRQMLAKAARGSGNHASRREEEL